MPVRRIIQIDEEKCTGCGACIPNCPEGALQVIDGKARLVSDIFCDGLGACLGECPEDAITIVEREAEPYDERRVMEKMVRQGDDVVRAHLRHLEEHGEDGLLQEALAYLEEVGVDDPLEAGAGDVPAGAGAAATCRGAEEVLVGDLEEATGDDAGGPPASELRHWPVQLNLVRPEAPFLRGRELLIAADCVPVAMAGFHQRYLRGRSVVIGCPKFDDARTYLERLTQILTVNEIERAVVLHMEVPCCFGLKALVERAVQKSGKPIEVEEVTVSIQGRELPAADA